MEEPQGNTLNKRIRILIFTSLTLVLLILGLLVYFFQTTGQGSSSTKPQVPEVAPGTTFRELEKPADTTGWKDFTNSPNKFSVKHPPVYRLEATEENPYVMRMATNPTLLNTEIEPFQKDLKVEFIAGPAADNDNLEQFFEDRKALMSVDDKVKVKEYIKIGGIPAMHFVVENEAGEGEEMYFTIYRNTRLLIYKFPYKTDREKEFEHILSTITFE